MLEIGGGGGGGSRGGRGGSMGSGGPGVGRNPSKGENLRGLQWRPRHSQGLPGPARGAAPPGHRGCAPPTAIQAAPATSVQGLRSRGRQKLRLALAKSLGQSSPKLASCLPGLPVPATHFPLPWYLMGVRGLLLRRLGERSLGWKEKPSLMLSRTEGATYVKPWGRGEAGSAWHHYSSATIPVWVPTTSRPPALTRKAWLALSLNVVSSGLSTGVCRVKRVSNWLTSSSDCCGQIHVGRVRGESKGHPLPVTGPT